MVVIIRYLFPELLTAGFQSGKSLKVSYDAVLMKVEELLAQLEDEKKKNLGLEDRLNVGHIRVQQVTTTELNARCRTGNTICDHLFWMLLYHDFGGVLAFWF